MIVWLLALLMPLCSDAMEDIQGGSSPSSSVLQLLSGAIQIPTISYAAHQQDKQAEFQDNILRFHSYLQHSLPRVHQRLNKTCLGKNHLSLLYEWQGSERALKPVLLMAPMDVVPVDDDWKDTWEKPPFSGEITDQFVHGRGALSFKGSLISILCAVEQLLAKEYQPKRTYYFALGHDDQLGGYEGNLKISEYLQGQKIELEMVLDQGNAVICNGLEGFDKLIALIGISEKGYANYQLLAQTSGGHPALPPAETVIDKLAKAVTALKAQPMQAQLSKPSRLGIEHLAPHMSTLKKLAMRNLWLTERFLTKKFAESPTQAALVRTTIVPTMMHAGYKDNVLPSSASVLLNCRLIPEDSLQDVEQHIKRTINDAQITVKLVEGHEAKDVSDVTSESYKKLSWLILQRFPDAVVVPSLVVGRGDARHYVPLTKNIFRFVPHRVDAKELTSYHCVNEKISHDKMNSATKFYEELITNF